MKTTYNHLTHSYETPDKTTVAAEICEGDTPSDAFRAAAIREQQRTWVGLTDEEVNTIYEQAEVLVHDSWVGNGTVGLMFPITLYKMFEAKFKEKNSA